MKEPSFYTCCIFEQYLGGGDFDDPEEVDDMTRIATHWGYSLDDAKKILSEIFPGKLKEFEDKIKSFGVEFTKTGWDDYDMSLELYGVPPDTRLSEECQGFIHSNGFITVFVNHTDKWETHYNWKNPFKATDGWRVSYAHKNDVGITQIEEIPESWNGNPHHCEVVKKD